jgi:hypothetical protein
VFTQKLSIVRDIVVATAAAPGNVTTASIAALIVPLILPMATATDISWRHKLLSSWPVGGLTMANERSRSSFTSQSECM